MIGLSNEIWKLLNSVSSVFEITDEARYKIHKYRLELIGDLKLFDPVKCIYISDYKHDIGEASKANFNVPILLKQGANKGALITLLQHQFKLRTQLNAYSFSDFIFGEIKKKVIICFHRGSSNKVIHRNMGFCQKISITISKSLLPHPLISSVDISSSTEYLKLVDVVVLSSETTPINIKQISQVFITKFCTVFEKTTETFIDRDKADTIVKTIILSLSIDKIKGFTYIPNIAFKKKTNGDETSSGGFIVVQFENDKPITKQQESVLYLLAQRWFSQNAIADFSSQTIESVLAHARKAAVSQVMLRNLSHNHGSHVLSRMTHPNQIEESRERMHEGIRYILSEKEINGK